MRLLLLAFAIGSVACTSTIANSSEYLPLAIGNQWTYATAEGSSEIQTVVGTTLIRGVSVSVIDYTASTFNEGLENYWSTEDDGDVLLSGFNRTLEGFGWIYDPPILVVEAPLFEGKTWTIDVTVYELPDTTFYETWSVTFTVYEDTLLSLPAGTFQCFGIGYETAPGRNVSLVGTQVDRARGTGPRDWFSDGTGRVQHSSAGQLFQLTAFGPPNSVNSASWGAIKGLFR